MELRAGIVEGRYTPAAAKFAGVLAQEMPSRSTELVCRTGGLLRHGRASQFRVGVALGQRWDEIRAEAERTLVEAMEFPPGVVAASASVDRVSLAMAEPRPRTRQDEAAGIENPIAVNFCVAFSAALTLHNAEGTPLSTIRYARVSEGGAEAIEGSLGRDLLALRRRVPGLRIVALADGAPEMQGILDRVTGGMGVAAPPRSTSGTSPSTSVKPSRAPAATSPTSSATGRACCSNATTPSNSSRRSCASGRPSTRARRSHPASRMRSPTSRTSAAVSDTRAPARPGSPSAAEPSRPPARPSSRCG